MAYTKQNPTGEGETKKTEGMRGIKSSKCPPVNLLATRGQESTTPSHTERYNGTFKITTI